jgi:flagellar hook-length control protein FliK
MSEASSGAQALSGRQAGKLRRRGAGRQGSFFAAILEKTLSGPAAFGKAAKTGKSVKANETREVRLNAVDAKQTERTQRTERADAAAAKTRRERIAESRKSLQPREETAVSSGQKAEKRAEELAVTAAQFLAVSPPEKTGQPVSPEPNALQRTVSLKGNTESVFSAAASQNAFLQGMNLPGSETAAGTKASGEKTRHSNAEKKVSAKDAAGPNKKERREESAKKAEKTDAAAVIRELKPFSAEEAKQDSSRQEIEIRVFMRGTDERFDDTLRTADERSVKESASGLLRRMREDGNSEIVKSARFILKDHNEGEIRLVLKPESLGEVRIRLSMQDNLIGGRILVENENVREVFEQNMPSLASAFEQSGLELGNLNVSVGNSGTPENSEERVWAVTQGRAAADTARASEGFAAAAYYFASHTVNLMA